MLQVKPHKERTAVFLNISGLFECFWILKLNEMIHIVDISGNILYWNNDFLTERKIVAKVNRKYSGMKFMPDGSRAYTENK